jgi:hypothetical protein
VITFEEKHGKRSAERHFGPLSIEETMSLENAREKHEKIANSFIEYRTCNVLDATEEFVLFHVSSDSNSNNNK